MKSYHQHRIEKFMKASGQEVPDEVTVPDYSVRLLRAKLILEEAEEVIEALGFRWDQEGGLFQELPEGASTPGEILKELADLSVVTIGTMSALGAEDGAILKLVDENNLTKIGGPVREDGKLLKPEGYQKVTPEDILNALKG